MHDREPVVIDSISTAAHQFLQADPAAEVVQDLSEGTRILRCKAVSVRTPELTLGLLVNLGEDVHGVSMSTVLKLREDPVVIESAMKRVASSTGRIPKP